MFSSFEHSLYSTIIMLTGEIGWSQNFVAALVDNIDSTLHYNSYFYVIIFIFMVTMPMVLMNLLIGLAVGDIAEMQNTALVRSIKLEVSMC